MNYILMKIKAGKRLTWASLFVVIAMFVGVSFQHLGAQIPEPPDPPRLVNDFANLLSSGERERLERQLVSYDDSTSTQIVIVTVRQLGDWDISEFSYELGDQWGVGQAGEDNGIVITLSEQDRQVFIATGWGIEGYITDVEARRIIDRYMIPHFRQGDYYGGFAEGSRVISELLSGAFDATQLERREEGFPWEAILTLIIIIVVILLVFGGNDGKGGQINRRGWRGPIIIGGGFGQGGGFGGGGFGGGGFGGGGFGGFGGGGFGGGGAGGGW